MNPSLATLVLVLLAGALLTLPLLPAMVELRLKRDAQPLNVIQQHAGEIRHFSNGFRGYIARLQGSLQECVTAGTTATGMMPDGDEYLLLGRADAFFNPPGENQATCPLILIAGTDIALPCGVTFVKEIYAAGRFTGGVHSTYRAILCEKDILLQRASQVMRWAHAVGRFHVEHDCDLYGRISSDQEIWMQSGCTFQRLNAPCIGAGFPSSMVDPPPSLVSDPSADLQSWPAPVGRRLFQADLEIQPGEVIVGNVVTRGKLHIGAGARVLGSVKSNKDAVLETGVSVKGSFVSAGRLHIGPRCRISGPVIAEHGLVIETETQCGAIQTPTTVSAPTIELQEGVLVFGTLWAREEGRVVPKG